MLNFSNTSRRAVTSAVALALAAGSLVACGENSEPPRPAQSVVSAGTPLTLRDTTVTLTFDASGIAEPMQQATVSTKLMGTVIAVRVHEGDRVRAGEPLVDIDARELAAKANQVAATIADAEALKQEATSHAARFRALYADSAATKAQFDAAETGLARADAAVRAASAGAAELEVMRSYATVRAPFAGTITARSADPGAFAAPGAPLVTVQDDATLRVSVSAPADAAKHVVRGDRLIATIDGIEAAAVVEGIVPAGAGNLFTVNALVANPKRLFRSGSAAVMRLPLGTKTTILVPLTALVRDGDLVGVTVRANGAEDRRWIRTGTTTGEVVEVLSGLSAGDVIVLPSPPAQTAVRR